MMWMWGKQSTNVAHLSCSTNTVPDPQCAQLHNAGGSALDSELVEGTEAETLAWLVGALVHAHA
jgi:hypothetical protein